MELISPDLQESRVLDKGELTTIVYVSSAVQLFSPEALLDLLERARENNGRLGITGMLLYKERNFMQALEGPDQTLSDLYSKIGRNGIKVITNSSYRFTSSNYVAERSKDGKD
jgi:Sensors of blue-light using FAD